jgi:hypothetical protein
MMEKRIGIGIGNGIGVSTEIESAADKEVDYSVVTSWTPLFLQSASRVPLFQYTRSN